MKQRRDGRSLGSGSCLKFKTENKSANALECWQVPLFPPVHRKEDPGADASDLLTTLLQLPAQVAQKPKRGKK
jgi:hypothetical protein